MNAKTILNKFLSTTLAVALLFGLSPLAATATELETADAATATDASTAPAVSADTTGEAVAETPAESPEPQYSKDDYTYMYLVKKKKCSWGGTNCKKYYEKDVYTYDESGMVMSSKKTSNSPVNTDELGAVEYCYDGEKNLISVIGPYYEFKYSYKGGRIKKYDMQSSHVYRGWEGPTRYKHKLKYKKKSRSVYNPECEGPTILSDGDKYFFDKKGRVAKAYWYKGYDGRVWGSKSYYSYDKKGNLEQVLTKSTKKDAPMTEKWKLRYKKGRLVKSVYDSPHVLYTSKDEIYAYSYSKQKVLKKYLRKIKKQQWRILNFYDDNCFGICQPFEY